jgi:hypothetical protein
MKFIGPRVRITKTRILRNFLSQRTDHLPEASRHRPPWQGSTSVESRRRAPDSGPGCHACSVQPQQRSSPSTASPCAVMPIPPPDSSPSTDSWRAASLSLQEPADGSSSLYYRKTTFIHGVFIFVGTDKYIQIIFISPETDEYDDPYIRRCPAQTDEYKVILVGLGRAPTNIWAV